MIVRNIGAYYKRNTVCVTDLLVLTSFRFKDYDLIQRWALFHAESRFCLVQR